MGPWPHCHGICDMGWARRTVLCAVCQLPQCDLFCEEVLASKHSGGNRQPAAGALRAVCAQGRGLSFLAGCQQAPPAFVLGHAFVAPRSCFVSNLPRGGAALRLARHLHASKDLQALVSVSTIGPVIGPVDVRSACDGLQAVVPQRFSENGVSGLGVGLTHTCWHSQGDLLLCAHVLGVRAPSRQPQLPV